MGWTLSASPVGGGEAVASSVRRGQGPLRSSSAARQGAGILPASPVRRARSPLRSTSAARDRGGDPAGFAGEAGQGPPSDRRAQRGIGGGDPAGFAGESQGPLQIDERS